MEGSLSWSAKKALLVSTIHRFPSPMNPNFSGKTSRGQASTRELAVEGEGCGECALMWMYGGMWFLCFVLLDRASVLDRVLLPRMCCEG